MMLASLLHDLLFDYTARTVALGAAILGIVSGGLGCFAVLRRQSLLGDAISHAALPGIALAFMLTGSKEPLVLMAGAAAAGWVGTLFVRSVVSSTRLKTDSALGLVLSVFFGAGLVLLTFIQRRGGAAQAGLDKFLFGQAAALMTRDVASMAILGALALGAVALFWKEFKLLTFDPAFAASLGFRAGLLDVLLTTLLVVAIVVGLQTVGVVLMSAMVVAPAAAARQWTDRLGLMVILAALFGALSGAAGALASSITARLPTGPAIVICLSAVVAVSLFAAPGRGLLFRWAREAHNRRRLRVEAVLLDLFELSLHHGGSERGHSAAVLRTMNVLRAGVSGPLRNLEGRGLAAASPDGAWILTPAGRAAAESLLRDRQGGGA